MMALDLLLDDVRAASGARFLAVAHLDGQLLGHSGSLAMETDNGLLAEQVNQLLAVAAALYHCVDLGRQVTVRISGSYGRVWVERIGVRFGLVAGIHPEGEEKLARVLEDSVPRLLWLLRSADPGAAAGAGVGVGDELG